VHCRDQDHAFSNPACRDLLGHLVGDVDDFLPLPGLEP
jgi:hypothetical protein